MGVFPKTIRSDMGWEVVLICNSQLKLRRAEKPELPFQKIYSFGTSTRNQRIEAWWNQLAGSQTETWREFFEGLEKDGFFDGGGIDKACLQFLYMNMIREHIHGFVEEHNRHRIRKQRNREYYLPTGRPNKLYHYPPEGTRDYGSKPWQPLMEKLKNDVAAYDLNDYLPVETVTTFCNILENGGFQTSFKFNENHYDAYLYLRREVWKLVKTDGQFLIIPKPTGVRSWIADNREENERHIEEDIEMNLTDTDNESHIYINEEDIHDEEESDQHPSDSEDSIVLNIDWGYRDEYFNNQRRSNDG